MLTLSSWSRGFKVTAGADPSTFVYFWFYEWNLFGATEDAQHSRGRWDFPWDVRPGAATLRSDGFTLRATVDGDRVDLALAVTNTSDHVWPGIAAIIPCFNPGNGKEVEQSPRLADRDHTRTWYVGTAGPALLRQREMHFNDGLRPAVDHEAPDSAFVFSGKWPTSPDNAARGAIVRLSDNDRWVAAIGWDDFVSAQGHNPWDCMHLSVRVGPLAPGQTVERRGRILLFEGTLDQALDRLGR